MFEVGKNEVALPDYIEKRADATAPSQLSSTKWPTRSFSIFEPTPKEMVFF